MNKLSKQQAYDLMLKVFNHWCFKEHAFEELDDFYDNYIRESGLQVFTQAMAWEKGTSYKDRKEFSATLYDYDREWLRDNDRHEEYPDLDTIHHRVLEFVKDILPNFMDVTIKPMTVKIETETISVEEAYWLCPSCEHKNKRTWISPTGNKCRSCNITVKLYD